MMKILFILLLSFQNIMANVNSEEQSLRSKIGPTVRLPLKIGDNYFFLSGGGVLLKTDLELEKAEILFKTEKPSASPVLSYNDYFIFGEGLHDHNDSKLYIYNNSKRKLETSIKINGHVQREGIVYKDILYVGAGPGGLKAIDLKKKKINWSLSEYKNEKLHIDSNPIIYKDKICFTSIYNRKSILCANLKGEVIFEEKRKKNPKGELLLVENILISMATDADMMKLKFDHPANLVIIDLDTEKVIHDIKLRGFNFFKPLQIAKDEIMLNLSTGDMITVNLTSGKIGYIGEFPEPFVSTPFKIGKSFCSLGLMGKLICKEKGKDQYVITKEKRFFESPVGEVGQLGDKILSVSRTGFFEVD